MAQHNETGKLGEQYAVNFLRSLGYKILHTNWRHRKEEIDIIAIGDNSLIIAEVKTRAFGSPIGARDILTKAKQKYLIEAAQAYIQKNNVDLECRFDLLLVTSGSTFSVEHIKEAFYPTL